MVEFLFVLAVVVGMFVAAGAIFGLMWFVLYMFDNWSDAMKELFLGLVNPIKGHKVMERFRESYGPNTEFWCRCECGNEDSGNIFTVNMVRLEHKYRARKHSARYAKPVKKSGWFG